MMSKKAQEEIVGFVAIVLVVVVIGLLFLSFSLQPSVPQKSTEISSFLDSAMQYTTDCAIGYQPNYLSLKDLIADCYAQAGAQCLNGKEVCSYLNQTIAGILDASYPIGTESNKKGYQFGSVYALNTTNSNQTDVISISAGNCSSNSYQEGDYFFSLYPGVITTTLRICY